MTNPSEQANNAKAGDEAEASRPNIPLLLAIAAILFGVYLYYHFF